MNASESWLKAPLGDLGALVRADGCPWLVFLVVFAAAPVSAVEINTSSLGQNGWFSDDTRAVMAQDGFADGTNLIGLTKTDLSTGVPPSAGVAGHDAAIDQHIAFGNAPSGPPVSEHQGTVHLQIGSSASGKSQISHIQNAPFNSGGSHAAGSSLGPGFSADYSWMGDAVPTVTASFKLGIKTAEFGSVGTSSRTGENVWDKILIYEPGNSNGGTSDGTWHTENITFTSGNWWLFDRVSFSSNISAPKTLQSWSADTGAFGGGHTFQDIYNLISDPQAEITSIQFGIGSGNAGGSVFVNQLQSSFYRAGDTTTFGTFTPNQIVPEPGTIGLLGAGLIGLFRSVRSAGRRRVR